MTEAFLVFFDRNGTVEAFLLVSSDHCCVCVFNFDGAEGEFIYVEVLIFCGASYGSEEDSGNDTDTSEKSFEHVLLRHLLGCLPMLNLDLE